MPLWFTPFRLALVASALDLLWAVQALGQVPRHASSTVSVLSLTLWMTAHLPAAVLAGGLLKLCGLAQTGAGQSTLPAYGITAGLGLAQTFALVFGLATWRRRSR
jgi:hypothetical protein